MIYLASRSPRRAEILQQLGIAFTLLAADIDETPAAQEPALDYVQRMAVGKAKAGQQYRQQQGLAHHPILAADTTVSWRGEILGKPEDEQHALAMLQSLSGQCHEVHSALAMAYEGHLHTALSSTKVWMKALSPKEIQAYVASREPMDKAGAYGIQGKASWFIEKIEGSYSGVMGLPIYELGQLLAKLGYSPWADA